MSLSGCTCLPGSRQYQPLDWEEPLLRGANKAILPSDVRKHPDLYVGQPIHWAGIVDTFTVSVQHDTVTFDLLLDQKFYDYIEDFGAQREKIFLSPYGEGLYHLRRTHVGASADTLRRALSVLAARGNLVFSYGMFRGLQDSLPVLTSTGARFIHRQFYSTEIFSYGVVRDSLGKVVLDSHGYPELSDYAIHKLPGEGDGK